MTTLDNPDELARSLRTFDIFSPEHEAARHEIMAYGRRQCPVVHTPANFSGFWMITRYEDVRRVCEDWETWSSAQAMPVPNDLLMPPINIDPPLQTQVRELLNPELSRTALLPHVPRMREIARDLVAGWRDRGSVELMSEFAGPFSSHVLVEVVFHDLNEEELAQARDISIRATEQPSSEVYVELGEMCARYLAKSRGKPDASAGVVGALTTGRLGDRPASEEEQLGALAILFLGGLDTTRSAIGSIAYRVATNPGFEQRLRDPKWVRRDLDEFLRFDSPVGCMARVATRDTELGGVQIKAGERVLFRIDSANRDEKRFTRADELVFDELRPGHAAFGLGVHRCIGSNLARLQLEIAFGELLKQVSDLRLAGGAEPEWVPGIGNALRSLPLNFDVVPQGGRLSEGSAR